MPTLTHNRVALMQNRYHDHLIKTKRGKIANLSTHIHDYWFGTDANLNTHIHDHWFDTDTSKTHSVIGAILTLVLTHHFSYLGVCRRLCYQASCCFGIVLYSDCPMFE